MKKEDIKKILEQADSVLGNLTDAQIQMYSSEERKLLGKKTINKNRNKESSSKGGKIGGKTTGKKAVSDKIGFYAIPVEERYWLRGERPYRRKLSEKDIKFILKNYQFSNNQYDLKKNKMSLKMLADKFNVSKVTIKRVIDKNK